MGSQARKKKRRRSATKERAALPAPPTPREDEPVGIGWRFYLVPGIISVALTALVYIGAFLLMRSQGGSP